MAGLSENNPIQLGAQLASGALERMTTPVYTDCIIDYLIMCAAVGAGVGHKREEETKKIKMGWDGTGGETGKIERIPLVASSSRPYQSPLSQPHNFAWVMRATSFDVATVGMGGDVLFTILPTEVRSTRGQRVPIRPRFAVYFDRGCFQGPLLGRYLVGR